MATYERLTPTDLQAQAFSGGAVEEPVVMVHLLRFRARAFYPRDYQGQDPEVSGEEAFKRYVIGSKGPMAAHGGHVIWSGPATMTLIGPPNERWDEVRVESFPSRTAFLELMADADYQASLVHRQAALAETRAIACRTI